MLRGIHKASSGWLGKGIMTVVMGLLVVSFAIWGIADIFRGSGGVEGDEIASAFADALGCRSGSLGSALADVAGSAADVTARAAGLGLNLGGSLG